MTWDYIAGFIDGEGSIVKRRNVYNIHIPQTHFGVLSEIREFTKCGYVYHISKRQAHWKEAWIYSAGGMKNTCYILKKVVKTLVVKKELADRAIREIEGRIQEIETRDVLRKSRIKRAGELRTKGWAYRKIALELNTDFGYVRRLLLKK